MAKKLGIGQEAVSRLEQRGDLLISTLRNCVETLGGSLQLRVVFKDRPPVVITQLEKSVEIKALVVAKEKKNKKAPKTVVRSARTR